MRWMMKKSKRDITKRFRLTDEQAKRLDSYLEKNKFTFTDFTHYLIKSELDRRGWLCSENETFVETDVSNIHVDLPIRRRKREKFNITGRPAPEVDPQLLKKLGGIGHNVNQIARSLNIICGYQMDVMQQFSFIDCLDVLVDIQQQIHKYLPEIPQYTISVKRAAYKSSKVESSMQKVEFTS
mgnify:FL=1